MTVKTFEKARIAMQLCRFAYKMYAQSVAYPLDPFFEGDAKHTDTYLKITRTRMMNHVHDALGTVGDTRKFDPIQYKLDVPPDPLKSAIYRGDIDNTFNVFTVDDFDRSIGQYAGFDLNGKRMPILGTDAGGSKKCGYFLGKTGMTLTHKNSGWTSFLGAVIYDRETQTAYITFRGSRSGHGERALKQALIYSIGNPDWVTDMNHVKELPVIQIEGFPNVRFAAGFWLAYASARKSMRAAFDFAIGGAAPQHVMITGHSLGGALAQCAYADITCGDLSKSLPIRDNPTQIECYPISAPPICLGVTSQHWISRNTNAANVHHYFCPNDVVHACDLVLLSGKRVGSSFVAGTAHPGTTAYHFGSQIALDATEPFPAAHEPYVIWKSLWEGSAVPEGFWQRIELDLLHSQIQSNVQADNQTIAQQISKPDIHKALCDTVIFEDVIKRARDWAAGITPGGILKSDYKTPAIQCIDQTESLYGTDNYMDDRKYAAQAQQRAELIGKIHNDASKSGSDTAGCVYHTLLVGIAAQRLKRDINFKTLGIHRHQARTLRAH